MDAKGQSILEVVIVLPFLFTFVGLLFKINMGIQMAINNIQYARSQIYVLTSNSPEYPRLQFRTFQGDTGFHAREIDLMVLGVADIKAIEERDRSGQLKPLAQVDRIGRAGGPKGSDEAGEPLLRTDIRIRGLSSICTQMNSVGKNVFFGSSAVLSLKNERWPFGKLVCQYEKQWIGDSDE